MGDWRPRPKLLCPCCSPHCSDIHYYTIDLHRDWASWPPATAQGYESFPKPCFTGDPVQIGSQLKHNLAKRQGYGLGMMSIHGIPLAPKVLVDKSVFRGHTPNCLGGKVAETKKSRAGADAAGTGDHEGFVGDRSGQRADGAGTD